MKNCHYCYYYWSDYIYEDGMEDEIIIHNCDYINNEYLEDGILEDDFLEKGCEHFTE